MQSAHELKNADRLSVNIPFPGFYESVYSQEVDNFAECEAEYMAEREAEDGVTPELRLTAEEFAEALYDATDYSNAYQSIARAYTDAFEQEAQEWIAGHFGLARFKLRFEFEEMTAPRYYNFETDRIFVSVPWGVVKRLATLSRRDGHARLRAQIKSRFTSYDGFLSHYPNELGTWLVKPLAEWDHNELGTLLRAILGEHDNDDFRDAVMWRVLDGDGCYQEWSDAVDWPKFEAKVADLRADKLAELREEDPDYVAPEPRCSLTLDLFRDLPSSQPKEGE